MHVCTLVPLVIFFELKLWLHLSFIFIANSYPFPLQAYIHGLELTPDHQWFQPLTGWLPYTCDSHLQQLVIPCVQTDGTDDRDLNPGPPVDTSTRDAQEHSEGNRHPFHSVCVERGRWLHNMHLIHTAEIITVGFQACKGCCSACIHSLYVEGFYP